MSGSTTFGELRDASGSGTGNGQTVYINKGRIGIGASQNANAALHLRSVGVTDKTDGVLIESSVPSATFRDTSSPRARKYQINVSGNTFRINADIDNSQTYTQGCFSYNANLPAAIFYGDVRHSADNTYSFGTSGTRATVVFAATGTINTSDEREKTAPLPIDDAVLDAWGDVQHVTFQWLDSIKSKGESVARRHFGLIAQQVRDAFLAHGLDGTRYGFLCYDEWPDEYETVHETREVERHIEDPILANRFS